MRAARFIFGLAAAWGFLVLIPGLFDEASFNEAMPPAITHPEFYYGFHGLALVFQLIFVMIAINPLRYRPLIPIAILEKLAFFLPVIWLYSQGRVGQGGPLIGAMVDAVFAALFALAWWLGRSEGKSSFDSGQ